MKGLEDPFTKEYPTTPEACRERTLLTTLVCCQGKQCPLFLCSHTTVNTEDRSKLKIVWSFLPTSKQSILQQTLTTCSLINSV
jgi:hypothetical protein